MCLRKALKREASITPYCLITKYCLVATPDGKQSQTFCPPGKRYLHRSRVHPLCIHLVCPALDVSFTNRAARSNYWNTRNRRESDPSEALAGQYTTYSVELMTTKEHPVSGGARGFTLLQHQPKELTEILRNYKGNPLQLSGASLGTREYMTIATGCLGFHERPEATHCIPTGTHWGPRGSFTTAKRTHGKHHGNHREPAGTHGNHKGFMQLPRIAIGRLRFPREPMAIPMGS